MQEKYPCPIELFTWNKNYDRIRITTGTGSHETKVQPAVIAQPELYWGSRRTYSPA